MNQDRPEVSDVSALNQALVEGLKRKGHIRTPQVERAFRAMPRHLFIPDTPLEEVYADQALPAKKDQDGQWLSSSSQPAIMGIMLEQLDLQPGHNVLEIGAGTGFNAALMANMVGKTGQVITVDIEEDLVAAARAHLAVAGCDRVKVICADGSHGYPVAAPYDRIILTVGTAEILPAWIEQLKPGGRLVLPLRVIDLQQSIAFEKVADYLVSRSVTNCGFMMLRGAFALAPQRITLGPEPGLTMVVQEGMMEAEQVYAWLTGPNRDWDTGLEVTLKEVFAGLALWLALHGLEGHGLVAQGDMVDRDMVPPLAGFGRETECVSTSLLVGEEGMAALMRSPDQLAPPAEANDLCASQSPFRLYVRQFGPNESVAQRLVEETRVWDAAGRPSTEGLRVRAYPKYADCTLGEGEFVIEKIWTRLVMNWPTAEQDRGPCRERSNPTP
jgi:protein-L-isoaspartate(D-aspartate) O-methyltransferase